MSKNEYLTFYFQRSGTGNDYDDGFSYGKLFAGGGAVKPRFFSTLHFGNTNVIQFNGIGKFLVIE